MSFSDVFMIVPGSSGMSAAIWFVILNLILYTARNHAHSGILSFSEAIHNAFRLSARSIRLLQKILIDRNRNVLLAQGREVSERFIEREFERIDATVRKDLSEYPALHRHLNEEITAIDENYKASTEIPPTPPAWINAVEAVANIPAAKGDPTVGNLLDDIHHSLTKSSTRALDEYRKASSKRHQLLKKMMPHWRNVISTLQEVDKSINSLLQRSIKMDRLMNDYEEILKGTDKAQRKLSSSSMTQFVISGLVLLIAVGCAFINFQLIAHPLTEMLGGSNMLMGFKVSSVAALVIILVQISLGLFLMESLRITSLFPVIGTLNDKIRVKMLWITIAFLLALASVEAGLAYMREILFEDDRATLALLSGDGGVKTTQNSILWITTAAQMGLGFILPFALTFVAIPLEYFLHAMRTVLGTFTVTILRTFEWFLRLVGNLMRSFGKVFVHFYDILIILPLGIEKIIIKEDANKSTTSSKNKIGGAL